MTKSITISNAKIVDFYEKHKDVKIEVVNLLVIDLLQNLLDENASAMNRSVNSEILSIVGKSQQDLSDMKDSIGKLQNDIVQPITLKFHESKKTYIDDIKSLLDNTSVKSSERIQTLLDSQNSLFLDKINIMINEIVPKSNQTFYSQLEKNLETFQKSLSKDTQSLIEHKNNDNNLELFVKSLETNSASLLQNIQQPLYSYINASETRLIDSISSLKDGTQESTFKQLNEFLGKYKNSTYKGQFGENQLENVLNKLFPSSEVINTTGSKASCDFRVNRNEHATILFETKDYTTNVSIDEVKKFIRDIDEQKCHGIFLSQNSGITSKQNFHIDIRNNLVLIYMHNVNYSAEVIKQAVDIIDGIAPKLNELSNDTSHDHTIPNDVLEEINKEYSAFVSQRNTTIDLAKEFYKKMVAQIESFKFPALNAYLTTKFGTILNNEDIILCDICNSYTATNNKSLAAHKRGCKKKHDAIVKSTVINIET